MRFYYNKVSGLTWNDNFAMTVMAERKVTPMRATLVQVTTCRWAYLGAWAISLLSRRWAAGIPLFASLPSKGAPHALSLLCVPLMWPKPIFLFLMPTIPRLKLRLLLLFLISVAGFDDLVEFVHAWCAVYLERCRVRASAVYTARAAQPV